MQCHVEPREEKKTHPECYCCVGNKIIIPHNQKLPLSFEMASQTHKVKHLQVTKVLHSIEDPPNQIITVVGKNS